MAHISTDQLRDISIRTVEKFLNNKIPLSEGLAKYASEMQLNKDQINRAIEATNSIAHLKILSLSDDRTVEFPLCKYAEVMENIVGKIEEPEIRNSTSAESNTSNVNVEKTATEAISLEEGDLWTEFMKQASINDRKLDCLENESKMLVVDIVEKAAEFAKDPEAIEKLAEVASDKYDVLSNLVFGEVKPFNGKGLFKTAELKAALELKELLKKAEDMVVEISRLRDLSNRASHVKQANISTRLGRSAGNLMGSGTKWAANKTTNTIKSTINSVNSAVLGKPPASRLPGIVTKSALYGIGGGAVYKAGGIDRATGESTKVWESLSNTTHM